jgi:hypothetical protein
MGAIQQIGSNRNSFSEKLRKQKPPTKKKKKKKKKSKKSTENTTKHNKQSWKIEHAHHENVGRVGHFAARAKKLHQVMKLTVNVAADSHRTRNRLDIRLFQ